MTKQVHLYTESNPNPNSLKFVANFMLVNPGESYDFADVEAAKHAPLAQELFESFSYVKRVFYMSNFVTVTKDEAIEWSDILEELKSYIKSFLESDKALLNYKSEESSASPTNESEIDIKIKGILDEYIKPAVEMDGGAIEYQSFDDGIVRVALQGSCSGCPSSMITLKSGIENLLKTMLPDEVKSVEAIGV